MSRNLKNEKAKKNPPMKYSIHVVIVPVVCHVIPVATTEMNNPIKISGQYVRQ